MFGANWRPRPTGDGPGQLWILTSTVGPGQLWTLTSTVGPGQLWTLTSTDVFGASRGPMPSADGPGHPRQYGDLVSRTNLFIKDAQQLYIASNS